MTVSTLSPWMEKGNARDFVSSESIDPRSLMQGIASGLCYLHNCSPNPLYHGDVRGCNVLISEEGQALIADFGLSFLTNSSFSISISGQIGGSLPWMAPETLEGSEATAAQDVWAFAMTALELFTREDPFYPSRGVAIMMKIFQGLPDRPSAENTCFRLTNEWWVICSECWHSDPSMRPTMLQVAKKIEQISNLHKQQARVAVEQLLTLDGALSLADEPLSEVYNILLPHGGCNSMPLPAGNFEDLVIPQLQAMQQTPASESSPTQRNRAKVHKIVPVWLVSLAGFVTRIPAGAKRLTQRAHNLRNTHTHG
ncbi:hypothetical protein SCLCIDRAFT_1216059 [Scleroderma citrinum Foug A]|uniref:Protein kinase domain-containing protein n=1 Tax=Scleroderma citrinum Foug A TaxID=1036808 RepID=A0A0C3DYT9_9AGAM|nr:hypothetical protein SCLCIDRAFT_1216059 [Scleroderma citrinum Foug A]